MIFKIPVPAASIFWAAPKREDFECVNYQVCVLYDYICRFSCTFLCSLTIVLIQNLEINST